MDSQWSKFMSQITEDLLTGFEEEDSIPRMAVEVGRALSNKRRRLIVYGVTLLALSLALVLVGLFSSAKLVASNPTARCSL